MQLPDSAIRQCAQICFRGTVVTLVPRCAALSVVIAAATRRGVPWLMLDPAASDHTLLTALTAVVADAAPVRVADAAPVRVADAAPVTVIACRGTVAVAQRLCASVPDGAARPLLCVLEDNVAAARRGDVAKGEGEGTLSSLDPLSGSGGAVACYATTSGSTTSGHGRLVRIRWRAVAARWAWFEGEVGSGQRCVHPQLRIPPGPPHSSRVDTVLCASPPAAAAGSVGAVVPPPLPPPSATVVTLWKSGLAFVDSIGEMLVPLLWSMRCGDGGWLRHVVVVDDAGWAVDHAVAALCGAVVPAVVPAAPVHPVVALVRSVRSCRATHITVLPSLLDAALLLDPGVCSGVGVVCCSGEVLCWRTAAAVLSSHPRPEGASPVRLLNVYGCAEVNADVAAFEVPRRVSDALRAGGAGVLPLHPLSAFRPGAVLQLDARVPVGTAIPGSRLTLLPLPLPPLPADVDTTATALPDDAVSAPALPRLRVLSGPGVVAVHGAGVCDGYVPAISPREAAPSGADAAPVAASSGQLLGTRFDGEGGFITSDVGAWVCLCEGSRRGGASAPSSEMACPCGCGAGGQLLLLGRVSHLAPWITDALALPEGWATGDVKLRGVGVNTLGVAAAAREAATGLLVSWAQAAVHVPRQELHLFIASPRRPESADQVQHVARDCGVSAAVVHCFLDGVEASDWPPVLPRLPSGKVDFARILQSACADAPVTAPPVVAVTTAATRPPSVVLWSAMVQVAPHLRSQGGAKPTVPRSPPVECNGGDDGVAPPHELVDLWDASWSDLGLDSLRLVELWSIVRSTCGVSVTLQQLWDAGTPRRALLCLSGASAVEAPSAPSTRASDETALRPPGAFGDGVTVDAKDAELPHMVPDGPATPITPLVDECAGTALRVIERGGSPLERTWTAVHVSRPAHGSDPSESGESPPARVVGGKHAAPMRAHDLEREVRGPPAGGVKHRRVDAPARDDTAAAHNVDSTHPAPSSPLGSAEAGQGRVPTLLARFAMDACVDAEPLPLLLVNDATQSWSSVLVVGSHGGDVLCAQVASSSGTSPAVVWHHRSLPDRVEGAAAYHRASHAVVVPCYDGGLHALCLHTGRLVWSWDSMPSAGPHRRTTEWADGAGGAPVAGKAAENARQPIKAAPVVIRDGGTIVVAGYDATLRVLAWDGARAVDKSCAALPGPVASSPTVWERPDADAIIIVCTLSGHTCALTLNSGSLQHKWTTHLAAPIFAQPQLPLPAGCHVVVGTAGGEMVVMLSSDGRVVCRTGISAAGKPIWSMTSLATSLTSCLIAWSCGDGTVGMGQLSGAADVAVADMTVVATIPVAPADICAVVGRPAVGEDGRVAAVAVNGTAAVWRVGSSHCTQRWVAVTGGEVFGAAVWVPMTASGDGRGPTLAVGGRDDAVWLWRV